MSFSDLAVAYGEYCSVLNDAVTQAEDDIWATNCSYRTFCLCIIIDSRILRSPLDTSQIFNFSRKKNPPTVKYQSCTATEDSWISNLMQKKFLSTKNAKIPYFEVLVNFACRKNYCHMSYHIVS